MSQKNKNSAFMHPVNISPDLAVIVGKGPMPRTEIVKKVWEYIKKHNCQDPNNKRNILPDTNLAKVFGSSNPIDMFQMTKALSKHIIK
ncbi:SWIB/MDM2 domain-containing protein [Candidatus Chlamydia sanziniae]|uniref:SWIB/MDM2 domain-containing protein n=1 Tax=Candidatus Chlamydia sanziniae TaxID=1806891 RepID=A0A1A9HUJ0_9CHLA|nr:SWIB/MDM2 domain-containing protein [Candidatus Chlamydia sanziniae]ANH78377.1 SWIB/MDM2 domain-containing protein [Candidatus Chlamydia sanziniae]